MSGISDTGVVSPIGDQTPASLHDALAQQIQASTKSEWRVKYDPSQYGDRFCLRNTVLNGRPLMPRDAHTRMREVTAGIFYCDYKTRIWCEYMWCK